MLKLNRDSVLKSFLEKVAESKRLNMKEIKLTRKEVDDLAQVIYEMMSETVSKLLEKAFEAPKVEEEKPKEIKPRRRKIIETIPIEKEPDVIIVNEPKPEPKPVNVVVEPPKPLYKNVPQQPVKEEPEEEQEDDIEEDGLYGGTW